MLLAFIGAGYAATFDFPQVALYPRLLLAVMAVLAVVIGGRSFFVAAGESGGDELPLTPTTLAQPALLGVMVAGYAAAIPVLGYFFSTLLALPLFTIWMGLRRPVVSLLCGLGFAGFVYLLFRLQLGVPLPRGLLF
ncbi:MAG: tripartite tricarboxylate transporter TctB family protein [Arachnia sp.]